MSIGSLTPAFLLGKGYEPDPYNDYVVMSLDMDKLVSGAPVDKSNMPTAFAVGGAPLLDGTNTRFGKPTISFSGTGQYFYQARPTEGYYDAIANNAFGVEVDIFYTVHTHSLSSRITSHKTTQSWSEPECYILVGASGGKYRVGLGVLDATRITSGYIIEPNKWHHISYGKSATGIWYLYVDGILQGTYTNNNSYSTWSMTIGSPGFNRGTDNYGKFKGNIANLRWWNGVAPRDGINNFTPPRNPWGPVVTEFAEAVVTSGYVAVSPRAYTGWNVNPVVPLIGSISNQPFPSESIDSLWMQRSGAGRYIQMFLVHTGMTQKEWLRLICVTPPLKLENLNTGETLNLPKVIFNGGAPVAVLGPVTTIIYDTIFTDGQNTALKRL